MTEQEAIKQLKMQRTFAYGSDAKILGMAIQALEKQIQKQNDGWISIDERLPDTDNYILLSFSNFTIPVIGRY